MLDIRSNTPMQGGNTIGISTKPNNIVWHICLGRELASSGNKYFSNPQQQGEVPPSGRVGSPRIRRQRNGARWDEVKNGHGHVRGCRSVERQAERRRERRTKRRTARQDKRVDPSPSPGRGVGEAHILSQEQVETAENISVEMNSTNQSPFNDKTP